jgi:hypothetical protein
MVASYRIKEGLHRRAVVLFLATMHKFCSPTTIFILLTVSLHGTPAVAQPCLPDGDVDQNGNLTPGDVLLAFQEFLEIVDPPLNACQQERGRSPWTAVFPLMRCASSEPSWACRRVSTDAPSRWNKREGIRCRVWTIVRNPWLQR